MKTKYNLLLLVLLHAGTSSAQHEMRIDSACKYFDYHFSLSTPEGWKADFQYYAYHITGPIPELMVVKHVEKTNESLEQFYKHIIGGLLSGDTYKRVDEGEETINGTRFKWIEFTNTQDGINFQTRTYICKHNNAVFSVNLATSVDRYPKYMPVLMKMLRTFKFED